VTFLRSNTDTAIMVLTGCFRGTLEEFEAAVLKTHAENPKHRNDYLAAIALVRVRFAPVVGKEAGK
jgi:hypothetical protein